MKKLVILYAAILMVILLAVTSGCQSAPPEPEPWLEPAHVQFGPPPEGLPPYSGVDTYIDVEETISTGVNEEFAIALYSNPRLGTSWYEIHDENMLTLVESEFVLFTPSTPVDGTKYFVFKALKTGTTEIMFTYGHGGTGPMVEQKVFRVEIK